MSELAIRFTMATLKVYDIQRNENNLGKRIINYSL